MVLEVALIDVQEGAEEAFRGAYAQARREVLSGVQDVGTVRMTQGVETPSRFVLLIEWPSVAAHEAFRESPAFARWRELIGPHFAGPPHVEHFVDVE